MSLRFYPSGVASSSRWYGALLSLSLLVLSSCTERPLDNPSLTVAVASNFTNTARQIAEAFTDDSNTEVILVSGSTGKLTAQILQGAPFDVFLSADRRGPKALEAANITPPDTRFTYALGQLALHSRLNDLVEIDRETLINSAFAHLAIANPDLAPYGRAAEETLSSLGLLDQVNNRLVRGENIAQTFHFIESGNAELGFVAYSQTLNQPGGTSWKVPPQLHSPIEQDAILIQDTAAGRKFLTFLQSKTAQRIIKNDGYLLPLSSHVE